MPLLDGQDYDPEASYGIAAERKATAMREITEVLGKETLAYWQFRYRLWFASRYCKCCVNSIGQSAPQILVWIRSTSDRMMFLWMLHAAVAAAAAASSDPVREETVFYLGSAWPVLRPLALELGRRFVEAVRLMEPVVETFQTV